MSGRFRLACGLAGLVAFGSIAVAAADQTKIDPVHERETFQAFFKQRFPKLPWKEYANGPYAVDAGLRKQWEDIMQFPPFDPALDNGKQLFNKAFANGKTYASCFPDKGVGIRQTYPRFDPKSGEIITIELALNQCREANHEKPLPYEKGDIAALSAYVASTSDGKPFDIATPDDPRALAAFEDGRHAFYDKSGPKNHSCAGCHMQESGPRPQNLPYAPALGILAAFPIYRSAWGEMGTIDRRLIECDRQVHGSTSPPQSKTYRDLEYYLSYVSNGVPIAGPGARP